MAKFVGFSTINKKSNFTLTEYDLIEQDIKNALMTRRGERLMNPQLGTIIWDLIMEPLDSTSKYAIIEDVRRIVSQEPRAEFISAQVTEQNNGIILEVTINYMNVSTNTLQLIYEAQL